MTPARRGSSPSSLAVPDTKNTAPVPSPKPLHAALGSKAATPFNPSRAATAGALAGIRWSGNGQRRLSVPPPLVEVRCGQIGQYLM
jgi:hypothetical protein